MRIKKKPEKNLENFYINRFGEKLYSMFFKDYTENYGDGIQHKLMQNGVRNE